MTLWVVAGCLFEVSFPESERWRWAGGDGSVTLLAEDVRECHRHFRFRAEGLGAEHGTVDLHFERDAEVRVIPVHVAPENCD